jgi:hypothetical protein
VHHVGAESDAAAWVEKCNMMAVIHTDWCHASTSLLWLELHNWVIFCLYILSLIEIAHCHLSQRAKTISCRSVVNQTPFEPRIFICAVWPLHMHRWIILDYTLVTEIKKLLTNNKIHTFNTVCGDISWIMAIYTASLGTKNEPLRFIHLYPIVVW